MFKRTSQLLSWQRWPSTALATLAIVGLAWFLFVNGQFVLRPALFPHETLFDYRSDVPSTHPVLKNNPASDRILVSLGQGGQFLNIHISAWTESGEQTLELIEIESGHVQILSNSPILRHRNIDLSDSMRPGKTYMLSYRVPPTDAPATNAVRELLIGQIKEFSRFPPIHWILWAIAIGVAIQRLRGQHPPTLGDICLFVAVIAFSVRWKALGAAYGFPLEGDAIGYSTYARQLSWAAPFATGLREPFYIWLQKAVQELLGDNQLYFRGVTLLLSVGICTLTTVLTHQITRNRGAALAAGLLITLGDFSVFNAVRGERAELVVFLSTLYFVVLFSKKRGRIIESSLGVLAGLAALTWLVSAAAILLAYPTRWIRLRLSWRDAAFFYLMAGMLVCPQLVSQKKQSGDALHSLNFAVTFYKNARETGHPSFEGEKMTWVHYFLKEEGALKMIANTARGYLDLFLNPVSAANKTFLGFHPSQRGSYFLFPFLILGFILHGRRRNLSAWIFLFCTANITVSFLAEIRDPRLFLQMAPVFALFTGSGLAFFFQKIRNWNRIRI